MTDTVTDVTRRTSAATRRASGVTSAARLQPSAVTTTAGPLAVDPWTSAAGGTITGGCRAVLPASGAVVSAGGVGDLVAAGSLPSGYGNL